MQLRLQDDPCPIFRVSQVSCWRRCFHFTQACSLGWGWGGSGGHRVGLGVTFSLYRGPGPLAEGWVQGRGPPEELALCHVVGSHGRRPSPTCWPSVSALAFGRLSGMQRWKVSHLPQKGSKELFWLTFWKERGRREEEEGQNRRRVWALRPPWALPTAGGGFSGWSLRACWHHDVRV